MYGRGDMYFEEFGGQVASHGGFPWFGTLLTLIVVGLVIAATVIAIILLINAARNRGVEVQGGRLAAFWFVGVCLTPIMLALYVLTLKPAPRHAAARAPMGGPVENFGFATDPTVPMAGFDNPTEPMESTRTVEVMETTVERNDD